MDLILCHQTADFDALGAAVGLSRLKRGAKIVLTGGAHPTVKDFLALHRDEFALIERRSARASQIKSIFVVDTQQRSRLGKAAEWLDLSDVEIELYDHHVDGDSDIAATVRHIEPVGAATTIIVEQLRAQNIQLTASEATVMALGIHVDTGSLTFEQTTPRDATALAWLLEQNVQMQTVSEYVEPNLAPHIQELLPFAMSGLQQHQTQCSGYSFSWVLLDTPNYLPGLSGLAAKLKDITEIDALLLGHHYFQNQKSKLTVIGRSRISSTDFNPIFAPYGGGGHRGAAALTFETDCPTERIKELFEQLVAQIPPPPTARDIMSSPVRTIRPNTTIEQAQRILLRYGHSGLSVVDLDTDRLVGVISRRDLDLAIHHGFEHAPVKGYMSRNLKTIAPDTTLPEIESLMVTYDVGRLPVIEGEQLIGIVTRTDVLRQLHQRPEKGASSPNSSPRLACLLPEIEARLAPPIWQLLQQISRAAQQRGWHLYLVGGAVRDMLLQTDSALLLQDIDLVVDGYHRTAQEGAGVELAGVIQQQYREVKLSVHGEFQTAALIWHNHPQLGSLCLDIATARTEFYPYPAANPEVEASSIRQDLYRRDFTINALAVRLTSPRSGELLDFFGGLIDLRQEQIRVLHANSFIEDPTRIYRAVRFAVRLGFELEAQTQDYIHYALASGVYEQLRLGKQQAPALTTRLRGELKYILEASYWKRALKLLSELNALRCLHRDLTLTPQLWRQIKTVSRWLYLLEGRSPQLQPWLIRLETMIASLKPDQREIVAVNLQLPKDSINRLVQLQALETKITTALSPAQTKYQKLSELRKYKCASLVLVAARCHQKSIRRTIWLYLTQWSKVQPPLDGNRLKQLGYKPGPIFKEILEDLLRLALEKGITDSQTAEQYVKSNYPQTTN